MIPKEIIEKAVVGGWRLKGYEQYEQEVEFFPAEQDGEVVTKWNPFWIKVLITTTYRDNKPFKKIEQVGWQQIAFDLGFWKALGKELGWMDCDCETKTCAARWWLSNAQNFFTRVLTGGDLQKYWEEILK